MLDHGQRSTADPARAFCLRAALALAAPLVAATVAGLALALANTAAASPIPSGQERRIGGAFAQTAFDAEPDWTADGGRIAYVTTVEQQLALVSVFLDGPADRTIVRTEKKTGPPAIVGAPDWSPDGSRLVYVRHEAGLKGEGDLWVIDANGTGSHRLTAGGGLSAPAWAPDGRRIAVAVDGSIVVLDAETGAQETWVPQQAGADTPAWSPDGTRLAYAADGQIRIAGPPGTPDVAVTSGVEGDAQPSFSPDGTQLVFTRGATRLSRGIGTITIANADGSGSPVALAQGSLPDWSRVGDRLVYVRPPFVYVIGSPAPQVRPSLIRSEVGGLRFTARVDPADLPATAWIEYGSDTNYGLTSALVAVTEPEFEVSVGGLDHAALYHARLVVRTPRGTATSPGTPVLTSYVPSLVIEDGAEATRSLDVTLTVTAPPSATGIVLANGPRLGAAPTRQLAPRIPWRLAPGARLGKDPRTWKATVSAQLRGSAIVAIGFSDTIVVDLDPPRILAASLAAVAGTRKASLRLEVVDTGGAAAVQISPAKRPAARWRPFAEELTIARPRTDLFVRVRDAAGNVSAWEQAVSV